MKQTFFIAGTDGGAGKTLIACGLLRSAAGMGLRSIAMKPLAVGGKQVDGVLLNPDALALQTEMSLALPYSQINPLTLRETVSPCIAADLEARKMTNQRLVGFSRGLMMQSYDLMLIEGVGGWREPINQHETMAGFVKDLKIPVILVVAIKPGCLNQAILTAEAIRADGVELAGWVANQVISDMPHVEAHQNYLERHLHAPCIGRVNFVEDQGIDEVSSYLNLAVLRNE